MRSIRLTVFATMFIAAATLSISAADPVIFDDEEPEITDRVARISSLKGDVSIRRAGMDDWEKAVVNLPVVEGDEITAADGSRFEIQFNANTHVRLAANSYLKVTTLNDDGIALSLSEGTLSATVKKFDVSKTYLEIDAPKTTVAVQRSGRYRIDAGKSGTQEIRVSVFDDGEARVYSTNSGFTIRDGRSAKIFIEGSLAGEVENGYASKTLDEFDEWVAERDSEMQKRLQKAHYGQFYDDDIYGADELSDHGDWIHTRDYGYVWRPNRTSIISYSDWSPYRYGHWRWVPVFGWTWVNDEPWGWATYHHGRWIWYNSGWYWSPYAYYRYRRSWWSPALVVVQVYNNNVCWYPLPWRRRYHNFNRHHRRDGRPGATVAGNPNPTTRPVTKDVRVDEVPDVGVITVPIDTFGKSRAVPSKVESTTARRILATPIYQDDTNRLPGMGEIKTRVSGEIRADSPPWRPTDIDRTGAAKREKAEPLDTRLRNKIIYGDRSVVPVPTTRDGDVKTTEPKAVPSTGAVGRPTTTRTVEPTTTTPPWQTRPQSSPPAEKQQTRPQPTQRIESPRNDSPKQRDAPPVKVEQPRSDPPRQKEPSQRSEPKSEPRKSDPPPAKTESRPAETKTRTKDN